MAFPALFETAHLSAEEASAIFPPDVPAEDAAALIERAGHRRAPLRSLARQIRGGRPAAGWLANLGPDVDADVAAEAIRGLDPTARDLAGLVAAFGHGSVPAEHLRAATEAPAELDVSLDRLRAAGLDRGKAADMVELEEIVWLELQPGRSLYLASDARHTRAVVAVLADTIRPWLEHEEEEGWFAITMYIRHLYAVLVRCDPGWAEVPMLAYAMRGALVRARCDDAVAGRVRELALARAEGSSWAAATRLFELDERDDGKGVLRALTSVDAAPPLTAPLAERILAACRLLTRTEDRQAAGPSLERFDPSNLSGDLAARWWQGRADLAPRPGPHVLGWLEQAASVAESRELREEIVHELARFSAPAPRGWLDTDDPDDELLELLRARVGFTSAGARVLAALEADPRDRPPAPTRDSDLQAGIEQLYDGTRTPSEAERREWRALAATDLPRSQVAAISWALARIEPDPVAALVALATAAATTPRSSLATALGDEVAEALATRGEVAAAALAWRWSRERNHCQRHPDWCIQLHIRWVDAADRTVGRIPADLDGPIGCALSTALSQHRFGALQVALPRLLPWYERRFGARSKEALGLRRSFASLTLLARGMEELSHGEPAPERALAPPRDLRPADFSTEEDG